MNDSTSIVWWAALVALASLVTLVILICTSTEDSVEDVHYDRQRAAARALRTPVARRD